MKLSFLGQSYEARIPTVVATATDETGTFLGKRYAKKQFTVAQRQQPNHQLTYRGISYSR